MGDLFLHYDPQFIVYRKCECTVYPLDMRSGSGRCKECGVKPEALPDYEDYVAVRKQLAEARVRIMELEAAE